MARIGRGLEYQPTLDSMTTVLLDILAALLGQPVSSFDVVNERQEQTIAKETWSTVLEYTVPLAKSLAITGFSASADVDLEARLTVNGVEKSNLRTTTAKLTEDRAFGNAPVVASEGQVVRVQAWYTAVDTPLPVKAEMRGILGNG